jgi:uncharacterized membrane protein
MAEITPPEQGYVARVAGPLYLLLFPVPVVCFVAALVTDVAYSSTAFLMWLHFSEWLIAGGLVLGAFAAIALIAEFIAIRKTGAGSVGWAHLALFFAALVVELINAFLHTRDGWTAVVPGGMAFSAVGVVLTLAAVATLFRTRIAWIPHRQLEVMP